MTNTLLNALKIESQTHDAGWDYEIPSRTAPATCRDSGGMNLTGSADGSCDYEHATGSRAIAPTMTDAVSSSAPTSELITDGSWDYDSPNAVVVLANGHAGKTLPKWRSETTVVPSTSSRDSLPTMWY